MSDPIDDLIGSIQKGENTPPVPATPDPPPAVPLAVPSQYIKMPDTLFGDQVLKQLLTLAQEMNVTSQWVAATHCVTFHTITLHYKTIKALITGQSYATQYQLSEWKYLSIESPGASEKLSTLPHKDRENHVIKLAEASTQVGRYPNVLFAFEWRDAATGKTMKHDLPKEGHVRG